MIFGNVFSTDRDVYLGGTRIVSRYRRTEDTVVHSNGPNNSERCCFARTIR